MVYYNQTVKQNSTKHIPFARVIKEVDRILYSPELQLDTLEHIFQVLSETDDFDYCITNVVNEIKSG